MDQKHSAHPVTPAARGASITQQSVAAHSGRATVQAGERYGQWVVGSLVDGDPRRVWCRCCCGSMRVVDIASLLAGTSTSCGCSPPGPIEAAAMREARAKRQRPDWRPQRGVEPVPPPARPARDPRTIRDDLELEIGRKRQTIAAWSKITGIPCAIIRARLRAGWPDDVAIGMASSPAPPPPPSPPSPASRAGDTTR